MWYNNYSNLMKGKVKIMSNLFNVLDFGAVPDGKTDSTGSFQKAIDEAGKVFGTVIVPPGEYLCNSLKMHPRTGIQGYPSWSYRNTKGFSEGLSGGSVIRLLSGDNKCLLDITSAYGVTVKGLCLNGCNLGEDISGILVEKEDYGKEEDTPRIEDCKIGFFTGDGIRFFRIWCFCIRHCYIHTNKGNGLYIAGWDGFILDNWFAGNKGYGICGSGPDGNAAVIATANRIEWNQKGGIYIKDGNTWNINGNSIDRSGGPAVHIASGRIASHNITITGNIFNRSGAPWRKDMPEYESSHVWLEHCFNIVCTSNTMLVGRDDGAKGNFSPDYGIVVRKLKNSIVKDNTGQNGAVKKFLVDLGEHGENTRIEDNFGNHVEDISNYDWPSW
jgi:hypothetical protein